MIKCICINDTEKPSRIPLEKWVKEGEIYTVIFATLVMPQREMAFVLEEIDLDDSCLPYEYFLAERFAFMKSDLPKLHELIEESQGIVASINDIKKSINIERTADTVKED